VPVAFAGPGRSGTSNDAPELESTFHVFASQWLADRQGEMAPATHRYHHWALADHLLPYFATWRLSEITIEAVDDDRRYETTQAQDDATPSTRASRCSPATAGAERSRSPCHGRSPKSASASSRVK
jgi:hypothetical protein